MNYSQYFENKVDAYLNDKYNVSVVYVSLSGVETLNDNFSTSNFSLIDNLIDTLDPFNVFWADKNVTLKVYNDGKTKEV